jgi:hypothetical protein
LVAGLALCGMSHLSRFRNLIERARVEIDFDDGSLSLARMD